MKKTNIIIADDHPLFRSGLRSELDSINHFDIIAETGDGEEAYHLISKLNPDVAILDFQMPKLNALEVVKKLDEIKSETRIILLTMYRDKKIFYKALDAGIKGYVLKDDAITDIVKAIDDVTSDHHFISSNLTTLLLERAKFQDNNTQITTLINNLTPAEKKVLSLVSHLKSNEEIAAALFISKRTVENYKAVISDKLGLNGARELLKFAIQNKEHII